MKSKRSPLSRNYLSRIFCRVRPRLTRILAGTGMCRGRIFFIIKISTLYCDNTILRQHYIATRTLLRQLVFCRNIVCYKYIRLIFLHQTNPLHLKIYKSACRLFTHCKSPFDFSACRFTVRVDLQCVSISVRVDLQCMSIYSAF